MFAVIKHDSAGGASGGNFRPQAGFLHSPITHPPRHNLSYNEIHNES